MKRSLGRNYLWNASYQLLLVLMPLVTTPYLSRVLGAGQVGVYSYTYSIANYFVIFATLGMAQHGVRVIAQAGDDRLSRSHAFWSAWAAQLCVAVPVAVVYLYYCCLSPAGGVTVALIWGLWVLSAVFDVSWLFFGVEEFRLPTMRSFITKLAGVALIFAFCHGPEDLWVYCLSFAGAVFVNAILLLPFVRRHVDFVKPTWSEVKAHFAPNLRLFAPVVAISLYTAFDKILLGAVSGMEQAGYFEYSDKIARMPLAMITALGTVMLPHMTMTLAEGKREEVIALLGKSIWVMEAAAMGMAFGIAAVAPEFSRIFLGEGFEACGGVMPIVAMIAPLIAASNAIGVQYLLPNCADKAYTSSVIFGAAVNIAVCTIALRPLGAAGAALATVAAEAAVLAYQCFAVRGELPLLAYFKEACVYLACGVAMYIAVRFAVPLLDSLLGAGWAGLIAEIVLGAAAYCLLCYFACWRTGRLPDLKKLVR